MADAEFKMIDAVASGEPLPAGGSAASLAGALGAALSSMVLKLTRAAGAKALTDEALAELLKRSEGLRGALTEGFAKDAEAYGEIITALKLPRATEDERAARSEALNEATLHATEVPLENARNAFAVMELCLRMAREGLTNARADAGVGAVLAHAGLRGALYNVEVNLAQLDDSEFKTQTLAEVDNLRQRAQEVAQQVDAGFRARITPS